MAAMTAQKKYFGTDGIRGVANEWPMLPEVAFRLGATITHLAISRTGLPPRVVVGKDTRVSGYMLETSLSSGVCSMGGRVLLVGPLPTPAVAQLVKTMRADIGVMISASHNPFPDNGIKLFGPDGFKLPDATETEIENAMEDAQEGCLSWPRPTGLDVGRAERLEDARGRYVGFVKATFPPHLSLQGVKIVVDAAHGAAYRCAPSVFSELGAEVQVMGTRPNGQNINDGVGALYPDALAREVKQQRADLGVALDGDADRVVIVDNKGAVVDGDVVLALCGIELLRNKKLNKNTVVATVMSNLGLEQALKREGGKLMRTSVGDRYVVEAMRKHGLNFGGEQSGHLIFLDHATTGDGLVAALQVLGICLETQKTLSDLTHQIMEPVPQYLLNVAMKTRMPLEAMTRTREAIRRIERSLNDRGRVLVRWSGTEPKLRILVEGPDKHQLRDLADDIAKNAKKEIDSLRDAE